MLHINYWYEEHRLTLKTQTLNLKYYENQREWDRII